jgi:putative transposase
VLTDVLREGARELLAQAIEAKVAEFLGQYRGEQDRTGLTRMVRNGYLPARTAITSAR